ncbi:hypothetical protein VOF76_27245, partial [Leclercia adecarboxylata]
LLRRQRARSLWCISLLCSGGDLAWRFDPFSSNNDLRAPHNLVCNFFILHFQCTDRVAAVYLTE